MLSVVGEETRQCERRPQRKRKIFGESRGKRETELGPKEE